MGLKKYISELKRRNVIKAGLAYLVVAWLILEVASVVLPIFNVPAYLMKTLLFILIIGFPVWLVFAWVYEMTPGGIKKTEDVEEANSIAPLTGQRLNRVIIGALSIVILLLLVNQFWAKKNDSKTNISAETLTTSIIGVLPFSNSKPDIETDYFGFAIADQIIGDLSYLSNIIVRPSSSIRKYEKQVIDSKIAAAELNVGYIVAGNFLMEGNTIRLNVELVEVKTNEMRWRDQIDIEFKNAFELQDIVAKKVVENIHTQFSKKEQNRINKDIPANPLAYEYYLRSISYPLSNEGDQLAIEMINKSIELDSSFAPAYNLLGERLHRLLIYGMNDPEKFQRVEKYYLKALELNEEFLSPLGNLAMLYAETARTEEAVNLARKMQEINPNNLNANYTLGYIYRYAGMLKESVQEMEKIVTLDPNNSAFRSIIFTYLALGDYQKVVETLNRYKESDFTIHLLGYVFLRQGNYKLAVENFNRVIETGHEGSLIFEATLFKAYIEGNITEALIEARKLEDLNVNDSEFWYFLASYYGLLGDRVGGIRALQRAVDGGYFNYPLMLTDSFLDSLRDDQEFHKVLEKAKGKHLAFKKEIFEHI